MTVKVNKLNATLLLLRLAAGGIFIVEGYFKLFVLPRETTAAYFASLHIPYPDVSVLAIAFLEFIGGILLVVGASTRIIATLFTLEMLTATLVANLPHGFSAATEVTMLLFAISITLGIMDGGTISIDQLLKDSDKSKIKYQNVK